MAPKNLPVAIYARVSTQEQAEGTSLEMQVQLCRTYALSMNMIPPEPRVYTDVGTGADLLRPGITALLSDLHQIGHVLVYKLDRLTRSGRDWYQLQEKIHGVRSDGDYTIISASQGYDLKKPDGRMVAALIIVMAEFERELIAQRTTDALDKQRGGSYSSALPLIASLKKAGYSLREIAASISAAIGKEVAHTTIRFLIKKHGIGQDSH